MTGCDDSGGFEMSELKEPQMGQICDFLSSFVRAFWLGKPKFTHLTHFGINSYILGVGSGVGQCMGNFGVDNGGVRVGIVGGYRGWVRGWLLLWKLGWLLRI